MGEVGRAERREQSVAGKVSGLLGKGSRIEDLDRELRRTSLSSLDQRLQALAFR